jgi:hypothetical protein
MGALMRGMAAVTAWALLLFWLAAGQLSASPSELTETSDPTDHTGSQKRALHYEALRISEQTTLQHVRARLGSDAMEVLFRVNRIDARHIRKGTDLMVPSRLDDLLLLSPFPREIPRLSGVPKVLLVSLFSQAFAAYEQGQLVRWGPTSTGLPKYPTPENLYHANWRARSKVSSLNRSWIMRWCVNLHTSMGVSIHQYDMPGYPASRGCIRLLRDDAQWLYNWLDLWVPSGDWKTSVVHGTAVIVFGQYHFGRKPPWKELADNPRAADVPLADIEKALDKYLKVIEQRAEERQLYYAQGNTNPETVRSQEGEAEP